MLNNELNYKLITCSARLLTFAENQEDSLGVIVEIKIDDKANTDQPPEIVYAAPGTLKLFIINIIVI